MRDDIFKRLTFGVRRTATQTKKQEINNSAALCLRVLPADFREEVKLLRRKECGEDNGEKMSKDMETEEGIKNAVIIAIYE
uniref:Gag-pol polyprotein n=1 Tax=Heterorhabditis bacteriophora TaxID=37862 RepID=A0A1I7WNI9_HETBA